MPPDMPVRRNVAVLLGSLRKDGFSARLAAALKQLAPPQLVLNITPIGGMPFYDPDMEESTPDVWAEFRNDIVQADAVLFITPEYNRSVPAVLKNAIDVGSRPYGFSVWNGKPAAVITLSPGIAGGYAASMQLRQSLVCLNVMTMPAPEVHLSDVGELLDESGSIKTRETELFLIDAMTKFLGWIGLIDHVEEGYNARVFSARGREAILIGHL